MKVQNSDTSIFMGDSTKSQRNQNTDENSNKKKSNTIFAGDLNLSQDGIIQKRKEAQQKAMKVVETAYKGERKIDDDLDKRKSNIDTFRSEIDKAQKIVDQQNNSKNQLKSSYGITSDSQEQKDLELLEKRSSSLEKDSTTTLTEEDKNRLTEIDAMAKTEYQQRALDIDASGATYRKVIEDNQNAIKNEVQTITAIKLGRLKSHAIVDANKTADSIIDAADGEIMGMLIKEAKDHIDTKQEEAQKEADEKAKEEEKQTKELDAAKAEKIAVEAVINNKAKASDSKENATTEKPIKQIIEQDSVEQEVLKKIQDIVDKAKMTEEDIKGAIVDTTV